MAIMSASGGQVQSTGCTGCFIRAGLSTVFNANIIVSVKRSSCGGLNIVKKQAWT